jgi:hypothetical protein
MSRQRTTINNLVNSFEEGHGLTHSEAVSAAAKLLDEMAGAIERGDEIGMIRKREDGGGVDVVILRIEKKSDKTRTSEGTSSRRRR